MIQIDFILNQFSKVPVSKMKPFIRNLLRMSVYQLLFMDTVPDSAVCNEAVKLAGKRGFRSLSGFVNGVLRTIGRNKEAIKYPDKDKDKITYLSVMYSMPKWLVEKFIQEQGEDKAEKLLEGLLAIAPVTVRLKESVTEEEKEDLLRQFEKAEIQVEKHPYITYGYQLKNIEGVRNIPGFDEGRLIVQDASSMLAVDIAGIKDGDFVIDVCAAPGGKALYAADKVKDTGRVCARDLTEYKAELIRDNIKRMKKDNVEVMVLDACILREEDIEKADVVLADLPCSGLGIMGKKRDIKYHASQEGLEQLKELQQQILSVVWQYVKPGGVLVYSTCTINKSENEENVKWFTEKYPFALESLETFLPEPLKQEEKEGMLSLLPGIHETDGFFMARLKREQ